MTKNKIVAVYAISWTESEAGWGQRPDGYSFHSSAEVAKEYVNSYNASLPKEVPYEYSFADGPAKLVEVSESLYNYVMNNNSVRLFNNNINSYKTFDANELKSKKPKVK